MSRRDKEVIVAEMKKLLEELEYFSGSADLCEQCGKVNSEYALFCDSCGGRLKPPERPEVKIKRILSG